MSFTQQGQAQELTLSTNYSSKTVRLSFDNLKNNPQGINLTITDITTGEAIDVTADRSLTVTLQEGITPKYLLTAQTSPATQAKEARPAS